MAVCLDCLVALNLEACQASLLRPSSVCTAMSTLRKGRVESKGSAQCRKYSDGLADAFRCQISGLSTWTGSILEFDSEPPRQREDSDR